MLLLMCQYLQSTHDPNECWAILAVAIRGAQSIGLHTTPRDGSPLEKELKKRAWYGCVYLDRYLLSPTYLTKCFGYDVRSTMCDLA
jgi:hypothetical protein